MTQLTGQNGYGYAAPNGHRFPVMPIQSASPHQLLRVPGLYGLTSVAIRFHQSPFYDIESSLVSKTLEGKRTRA